MEQGLEGWISKAFVDDVINEGKERGPVAVDIGHHDGFGVEAELGPGEHFEKFIEAACAPGQKHNGVAIGEHQFFAFMHRFGDDEVVKVAFADFPIQQVLGDDAEGLGGGVLGGDCDGPHQPDIACAIDQTHVFGPHGCAERARGGQRGGVFAVA